MKTLVWIILILFVFAFQSKADTLLINIKKPNLERFLLYDNKYFLRLRLFNSSEKTGNQDLSITEGTYEIINNKIYFKDDPPMEDTIKTRYWTWPPRQAGPDYTYDYWQLVFDVFGPKVKIDNIHGDDHIVETATINKDGILVLNRKSKYIIQNYNCR